jgi:hypothetical protein
MWNGRSPVFQYVEFGRSPVVGVKRELREETVMADEKKFTAAEDRGISVVLWRPAAS